ncbi:MAG TPA: DUF4114 domain-containing protein [Pedobacter sp.]|jgi:hypothetical protein
MKKLSLIFLILVTIVSACRKKTTPPASSPVDFTGTNYKTIGTFDESGKPQNMGQEVVSDGLKSFLNTSLPERTDLRKTNPELLTTKAIADISLTAKSNISITFVSQGTEFANTIAFYTYPANSPPAKAKDIKEITYVFPNTGATTTLKAGDKVNIGSFNPGTSVGFVLLKNAWNSTTKTVTSTAVHFASNDVLNPEFDPNLKKHAVLINYEPDKKVLIGFEDIDRTQPACDHDFNDVVVFATVTPE